MNSLSDTASSSVIRKEEITNECFKIKNKVTGYEFFEQYPDINLVTRTFMDNTDFSDMDSDVGLTFLPPNNDDITIIHTKKVECGYFVSPKYLEKYGYLTLKEMV